MGFNFIEKRQTQRLDGMEGTTLFAWGDFGKEDEEYILSLHHQRRQHSNPFSMYAVIFSAVPHY